MRPGKECAALRCMRTLFDIGQTVTEMSSPVSGGDQKYLLKGSEVQGDSVTLLLPLPRPERRQPHRRGCGRGRG